MSLHLPVQTLLLEDALLNGTLVHLHEKEKGSRDEMLIQDKINISIGVMVKLYLDKDVNII